MQNYELTIVLSGDATAAKKKSANGQIKKIVETFDGKLGKVDEWGKIELSYPIKGEDTGVFLHFPLELKSESVNQLNEKLKVEEEIIRHLLVKVED